MTLFFCTESPADIWRFSSNAVGSIGYGSRAMKLPLILFPVVIWLYGAVVYAQIPVDGVSDEQVSDDLISFRVPSDTNYTTQAWLDDEMFCFLSDFFVMPQM